MERAAHDAQMLAHAWRTDGACVLAWRAAPHTDSPQV